MNVWSGVVDDIAVGVEGFLGEGEGCDLNLVADLDRDTHDGGGASDLPFFPYEARGQRFVMSLVCCQVELLPALPSLYLLLTASSKPLRTRAHCVSQTNKNYNICTVRQRLNQR